MPQRAHMAYDPQFTVAGLIRTGTARAPDAPMVTAGSTVATWAGVYRRACQVAQALLADGVQAGDRVVHLEKNSTGQLEVLFACSLIGAVHTPVNWRLSPAEIAAVVADARPAIVFGPAHFIAIPGVREATRSVVRTLEPKDGADPPASPPASAPTGRAGAPGEPRQSEAEAVPYEDWLAGHPATDPGHEPGAREPVVQLYTSGTTGLPKGVMLSNANIATAVSQAGETFGVDDATVSLVAMPMFHIGGLGWALCGMSRGGHSVVLREVDPAEVLRLIAEHRVTETFVVPAVLMALLAHPALVDTDLSSLRTIFYGASPIAEDVLVRCVERFRCGFAQVYGMTETTGAITVLRPEDHDLTGDRRHLLRSAGRPLADVELRVVDPTSDVVLDVGQVGEIHTRSPYNMLGYFHKEAETAATITPEGWLRTGDAGYLDSEGYLFLHDRIKDMVVTGGENVYPAEVENVLLGHPDLLDAAVIGVPDERWGETVKAVVVARPGAVIDENELMAFCRDRLAHFKCPTSVDVVESLPRNPTGKVLKRELREPYWQGIDRRIR